MDSLQTSAPATAADLILGSPDGVDLAAAQADQPIAVGATTAQVATPKSSLLTLLNPVSLSLENLLAIGLVIGLLIAVVAYRVALHQRESTRWVFSFGCVAAAILAVVALAQWSQSHDAVVSTPPAQPSAQRQLVDDWGMSAKPSKAQTPVRQGADAPRPMEFESRISQEIQNLEAYHAQLEQHLASLRNATGEQVKELERRINELDADPGVSFDCRQIQQELRSSSRREPSKASEHRHNSLLPHHKLQRRSGQSTPPIAWLIRLRARPRRLPRRAPVPFAGSGSWRLPWRQRPASRTRVCCRRPTVARRPTPRTRCSCFRWVRAPRPFRRRDPFIYLGLRWRPDQSRHPRRPLLTNRHSQWTAAKHLQNLAFPTPPHGKRSRRPWRSKRRHRARPNGVDRGPGNEKSPHGTPPRHPGACSATSAHLPRSRPCSKAGSVICPTRRRP